MTDDLRTDSELVSSARQGDLRAFEELVRRHSAGLFAFIYRMVGNRDDAEELAQEAWVRAWQGLKGFKGKSGFKTWLFRIGINLAINFRSRRKVHEELSEIMPAGAENEPGTIYQQRVREELVKKALQGLPPAQRTALVLSVYEGLSYQEIARVMGKSVRAVDSLLVRARWGLRQILEPARKKGLI